MDRDPATRAQGFELIELEALVPLYEEALSADTEDIQALAYLGHAYTRLGRLEEGLAIDLRLTRLVPEDAVARYNLGCSFALLDRTDQAFEALEASIRLGYRDPEHMLEDEDLRSLREDARFGEILTRLRRSGRGP